VMMGSPQLKISDAFVVVYPSQSGHRLEWHSLSP
jgi:hypothetical protein